MNSKILFLVSLIALVNCSANPPQQQSRPNVIVYTKKPPPPPPFSVFNVQLPAPVIAPQTIAQWQQPQSITLLPSPPSVFTINAPPAPPPVVRIVNAPGAPLAAILGARKSPSAPAPLPAKSS